MKTNTLSIVMVLCVGCLPIATKAERDERTKAKADAITSETPKSAVPITVAQRPAVAAKTYEHIDLAPMLRAYNGNEIRADDAYKGHYVEFDGVAGTVERGIFGITLVIGTGKSFEPVQVHCSFGKSQTDAVKRVDRGDRIRVRGQVQGLMLVSVGVRDCELVP